MTAPLQPPNPADLSTVAGGRYAVQIDTSTNGTADWEFINGITSFVPTPNPKLEDITDIYSDGWTSQGVFGNELTIAISGKLKGLKTAGVVTPDPGLSVLLEKSYETGDENMAHLRYWRYDEVAEAREGYFAVNVKYDGGTPSESQKWSGTLNGQGKPTDITKPTTP
ncbi:phage tail tube protein [Rhodococcoides fascians]|uniref:phage tail tube protein n=1 Tax=Rhodococcoides fascians TaxID=1828 RepID=UPI00055DF53C|nr:hypothetical protein [Rhodococcus fascians]